MSEQYVINELNVLTDAKVELLRAPIGPFPSREAAFEWAHRYVIRHGGNGAYGATLLTSPEADH